jgi:hypothetical protein
MYPQYKHFEVQEEAEAQKDKGYFEKVEDIAGVVEKYSLQLFVILSLVWLTGRIMGAASGNTIFEPQFIRWAAVAIRILLLLFLLSKITGYIKPISENYRQWPLALPWIFFAAVIIITCFAAQGYYTASSGLFSAFAEWTESMSQSLFLMSKSFKFSPMLPVNLTALIASGAKIESEYVAPFLWGYPYLLVFFVWSLLYGSLLLFFRGPRRPKVIHLIAALAGLLLLMVLKAFSMITDNVIVILHACAALMILCQILMTYSSLRAFIRDRKSAEIKDIDCCLPPRAWALFLILIIFLPILADLDNQNILSSASIRLIERNKRFQTSNKDAPQYKAATEIIVRTGPAIGENIVTVLPKGTIIYVKEEKNEWVSMGENLWISSKFLSPLKPDSYQEKAVVP